MDVEIGEQGSYLASRACIHDNSEILHGLGGLTFEQHSIRVNQWNWLRPSHISMDNFPFLAWNIPII